MREIVSEATCAACHAKFKTETTTSAAFHGGGRVDPNMCNVCHNPGRTTNLLADSASFVHRIHNGAQVATPNLFHGIAATYPRDVRDCNTCHGSAPQGGQSQTVQTRLACQGCHDYVSFTGSAAVTCAVGGNVTYGTDGKPVPCNHVGGTQASDSTCASCHGPTAPFPVAKYHVPVAKPDPPTPGSRAAPTTTPTRVVRGRGRLRPGRRGRHHLRRQERPDLDRHDGHAQRAAPVDHVQAEAQWHRRGVPGLRAADHHRADAQLPRFAQRVLRVRGAAGRQPHAERLQRLGERLHPQHLGRHRDGHGRGHAQRAGTPPATTPSS
ncbi:MAG: hypothetical protein IPH80_33755 [Myxococcales bacterium]|nr:hypothetical protein [Myxococcales bacterium]